MIFRKATTEDIDAIVTIYDHIHDAEEAGVTTTGWSRSIYPKMETAEAALERDDIYVCELTEEEAARSGADRCCLNNIAATAIINKIQVDVYAEVEWEKQAADEEVLVLHTLVVEPKLRFGGIGREFIKFYEQCAREQGCTELRIDTNARNAIARRFYAGLGYKEVGMVPTVFNGIPGVDLVMLEKAFF